MYVWKEGVPTHGLDANEVGQILDQLRLRNGGSLDAETVVAAASDPTSVLHAWFEWDDSAAAVEYRRVQARGMLRSILVRRVDEPDRPPVRAFVTIRAEHRHHVYTDTTSALANPELRKQVLRRALGELAAWRRRYEELEELAEVFAATESAREAVSA